MDDNDYVKTKPNMDYDVNVYRNMDIRQLVQSYRYIRDNYDRETKIYNQLKANTKAELQIISMILRDRGDELGVDSFRTPAGTAYRTKIEHFRVGNFDKILEFIQQTGNWQMLEKRIAKLATKEICDQMGEIIDGVDYSCETSFVVRKS